MRLNHWYFLVLLMVSTSVAQAQSWFLQSLPYIYSVASNGSLYVSVGTHGTILSSFNGVNWSPQSLVTNEDFRHVIYVNGLFVALGTTIATSADGMNWTYHDTGADIDTFFEDVIYANNRFVAVGYNGTIVTSVDGVTWTLQSLGDIFFKDVIYANGVFVIMGLSNQQGAVVATSSDAVSWNLQYQGQGYLSKAIYVNNQFLAVGGQIATSVDGKLWRFQDTGTGIQDFNDVIYANGKFVAVGYRYLQGQKVAVIAVSSDGMTWMYPALANNNGDELYKVIYANSLFVAVGSQGTIVTSPDGMNWTYQNISARNQIFRDLIYANGQFVVVGESMIATSSDGISWSQQNQLLNVAWGGGQWVGVGTNGMVVTSPDGKEWTYRQPVNSNNLQGVVWGGSRWVAVGNGGTVLASPDGITWSNTGQAIGSSENLSRVSWSGSLQKFIAVGSSRTVYKSTDGTNWTSFETLSSSIAGFFTDIVWGGSTFLSTFVGTNNGILGFVINGMDSQNSWLVRRPYPANFLMGAAWNGSRFMVVGSMGSVYLSTDGTGNTWPANPTANISDAGALYGVAGAGPEWVAVGVNSLGTIGKIFSSNSNGTTWTEEPSLLGIGLFRVVWGNGQFLAVGDNNTILARKSDELFQASFE